MIDIGTLAPLVQALGAPLVVLLVWLDMRTRQHKTELAPAPSPGQLAELLAELRSLNESLREVADRLLAHTSGAAPALAAALEARDGVNLLVELERLRDRDSRDRDIDIGRDRDRDRDRDRSGGRGR